MNVKLMIQNSGVNTLKESFVKSCNGDLKKLYVIVSGMKETGYETFEECLIDLKARKHIMFGVDRKYTTKKMLENLFRYTKNVYIYANEESELEANIFVFEYADRAEAYLASGNISDSFFEDNRVIYTKVEYDLKNELDSDKYEEYIAGIVAEAKEKCYEKLSKELIERLAETKAIFTTKQYIHNVMSISELLGNKKEEEKQEDVEETLEDPKLPKVDLSGFDDIDINVDTSEMEDIEKQKQKETELVEEKKKANVKKDDIVIEKTKEKAVSKKKLKAMVSEHKEETAIEDENIDTGATLDIESMLFEKAHVKLNRKKLDKIIKQDRKVKDTKEEVPLNKKIDLGKVSNIIIELRDKPTKGKDVNVLKISNQIKDLVPTFFEIVSKGKNVEKDGVMYKESKVTLEIIDVVANEKRKDSNALLTYGNTQSFIMFISDELQKVEYKEGDLARIIKLADDTYHIEVIPQEIEEYNLWKKLCTQELRGSTKRFGVM